MEFKEQKQYQEIKAICNILSNNFNIFLLKQLKYLDRDSSSF